MTVPSAGRNHAEAATRRSPDASDRLPADRMRAAWYEQRGDAATVFTVGETDTPVPGEDEVRIRIRASGVNPGDVKKRSGYFDSAMPYPRVIPHGDGAGIIDAVGSGVSQDLLGERVWCYGAQWYRPFGTAAEYTTVPQTQAVRLADPVSFEVGACLGIPGLTSHRAVFADGRVTDRVVLVVGAAGAVGSFAVAFAAWDGAQVIGVVRHEAEADLAQRAGASQALVAGEGLATRIRAIAPGGVDRIIDVSFSANADLYAEVLAIEGVVATYFSPEANPVLPYFPLLFKNAVIRFIGSDDIPADAKRRAARDITTCLAEDRLMISIGLTVDLKDIARAHDAVERRTHAGRVVVVP
jgi:NADPH2:quinone reductase